MVKQLKAIPAYPLQWPVGWKRTTRGQRKSSRYQVSFGHARDEAMDEVRLIGAVDAVLSTNVPIRRDGLPYSNMREPEDPGVALYWTVRQRDGMTQQRVIACDSWRTVRENMRAVCRALAALREMERTGASEILDRAYQGFAALPAGDNWREVFGFKREDNPSADIVQERYRELAHKHHPDRGGDPEFMVRLNKARDDAQREMGQ